MRVSPKTQQKRLVKRLALGAFLLLGGAAAFHYTGQKPAAPMDFAMPVEMVTLVAEPLDATLESVGTLVANESVILRPQIAGRVTGIFFTEGAALKKGDKLFQIDDQVSQAQLKQAAANLRLAQVNYARFAKLATTGAATKQRFEEAQANLGVAQANHDLARAQVEYATITAPFDGVIGLRKISPGDYVNAGQELANFVSYDPMKVDFSLPESEAGQLKAGQTLAISVEALPDQTFTGTVYAIDPQVDVAGRSISLRATIPNADNALRPGYFAHVHLAVSHNEEALLIPEAAVVPQGDKKLVYAVSPEGIADLVPVTLGTRHEGTVEVTSGLKAGDRIIVSGQMKVHPKAKVMDAALLATKPAEGGAEKPAEASTHAPDAPAASPSPAPANADEPQENAPPTAAPSDEEK